MEAKLKSTLSERIMNAVEAEEDVGFCLACGEEQSGVEPDARRYECDCCGERKVYGAQELLLMGVCG